MEREYASVWIRLGALVIDGLFIIPFYLPLLVLSFKAGSAGLQPPESGLLVSYLVLMVGVIFTLWNTIWRMGKTGQSLGRKFLHIAVLDEQGRPIGVGMAILREVIGRWLSAIVCYIGYLNAFWDKKNQMWHDKIASCYVFEVEEGFS